MNISQTKQELINFLRNQDVLTTTVRGVTTFEDTGTFDADETHTVANSPTNLKNVRSVTRGTVLVYGQDYTVNFVTGVISFTSAQTGAYTISYDSGSTDKIYPDFPRDDLTISSYPRIAIDVINGSSDVFGIGGSQFISNFSVTIVVYDDNQNDIESVIDAIRTDFVNNASNFYYFNFIKPTGTGPMISSPDRSNEIMQRNIDYQIIMEVETKS